MVYIASCGCKVNSVHKTFPYTVIEKEIDYNQDKLVDVYVSGSACIKCVLLHYFTNNLADICSTRKMIDSVKNKAKIYNNES